ncbi:hypothetical protein CCZ27_11570 [Thauera sinica]|nr:hypothetical protein CCZ27_11570 [Thauera sp. K11]
MQLQQVSRALDEAERTRDSLAGQLKEAQAARDAAEEKVGSEGAARRGLAARLEQASSEKTRLDGTLAETRKSLEARTSELAAARAEGERLQSELAGERGRLKQVDGQLGQCTADNAELAGSARELLKLYADKGVGDVLSANDPVLGIGRVRLENLMERYGDRIADHDMASNARRAADGPGAETGR